MSKRTASLPLVQLIKLAEMATRNRLEATLRTFRLSSGQLLLLVTLEEMGEATAAELSRRLHILPQSMTALLKPLIVRDLLQGRPDGANRRRNLLSLSKAGHAQLVAVRAVIGTVEEAFVQRLSAADLAVVRAALVRIAEG
jgi:MarR family transcriptional regulator, lower aerobic nicotinate degradation pathway regulator